jgi:hypothetical protein
MGTSSWEKLYGKFVDSDNNKKPKNKMIGIGLLPLLIVFSGESFGIGFLGFYRGISWLRFLFGFDVYPNPVKNNSYKFEISLFFLKYEIGLFSIKRIGKIYEHYI